MNLMPTRSTSKKRKAMKAVGQAGKQVTKVKAAKRAPKAAGALWAGKRSGKLLKGALVAVVGVLTLRAIRKRMRGGGDVPSEAESYRTSPTPASSQQTSAMTNGSAPAQSEPPVAPPLEASATPPHGDELTVEAPTSDEGESGPGGAQKD